MQHFKFWRNDAVSPAGAKKYADAEIMGMAKGLVQILWERGFDTSHMNKDEMTATLSKPKDFAAEKGGCSRSASRTRGTSC